VRASHSSISREAELHGRRGPLSLPSPSLRGPSSYQICPAPVEVRLMARRNVWRAHTHAHARPCARAHTHTPARAHSHTHTHARTHTQRLTDHRAVLLLYALLYTNHHFLNYVLAKSVSIYVYIYILLLYAALHQPPFPQLCACQVRVCARASALRVCAHRCCPRASTYCLARLMFIGQACQACAFARARVCVFAHLFARPPT
jgi:hypothetical protein